MIRRFKVSHLTLREITKKVFDTMSYLAKMAVRFEQSLRSKLFNNIDLSICVGTR